MGFSLAGFYGSLMHFTAAASIKPFFILISFAATLTSLNGLNGCEDFLSQHSAQVPHEFSVTSLIEHLSKQLLLLLPIPQHPWQLRSRDLQSLRCYRRSKFESVSACKEAQASRSVFWEEAAGILSLVKKSSCLALINQMPRV